MKVLLDECVPRKFGKLLENHEVKTVTEIGWNGIKNGELLKKAALEFDVLISVDRNIAFQQNLKDLPLPVIVLHSSSIKLRDLQSFTPSVLGLLKGPLVKEFYHLSI